MKNMVYKSDLSGAFKIASIAASRQKICNSAYSPQAKAVRAGEYVHNRLIYLGTNHIQNGIN